MDNRDRDRRDKDEIDLEDPLGIAQEPVPHDPAIHASSDEESVRRRRKRAGIGAEVEERRTVPGGSDDPEGATAIDMGSGGDGSGIKPPSR